MAVKDVSEITYLRQQIEVGERRQRERREHRAQLDRLIDARERTLQTYRDRLAAAECPSPFADAVVAAVNGNRRQPKIILGTRHRMNDYVGPAIWEIRVSEPVSVGDVIDIEGNRNREVTVALLDGKLAANYTDGGRFCGFIKEEN